MKYVQLSLLSILIVTAFACTTVFQRADGTYDVPRAIEVRSPFGTNAGFVKVEHCNTKVSPWYWTSSYIDCHQQKDWVSTQSQGQGGQVAAGALIGLGFGLGSAFAPANGSSASLSSSAATNTITHGHKH